MKRNPVVVVRTYIMFYFNFTPTYWFWRNVCVGVENKPKCSDMTLKPDQCKCHSIYHFLCSVVNLLISYSRTTASIEKKERLNTNCTRFWLSLLWKLSGKSTQCFARMVKKLANSTLSDGKKGKKKYVRRYIYHIWI